MKWIAWLCTAHLTLFGLPSHFPLECGEQVFLGLALVLVCGMFLGDYFNKIGAPAKLMAAVLSGLGVALGLDLIGWIFEWTWTYRDIQVPLWSFFPEAVFRGIFFTLLITLALWLRRQVFIRFK